jgi:hypothetical protein
MGHREHGPIAALAAHQPGQADTERGASGFTGMGARTSGLSLQLTESIHA